MENIQTSEGSKILTFLNKTNLFSSFFHTVAAAWASGAAAEVLS